MLLDETGNWEVAQKERDRWLGRIVRSDGCWKMSHGSITKWGHVHTSVKVGAKRRSCLAHRLVYFLIRGPIPIGMMVLHNCPGGDNPSCVNPDHMFLGSDAHNVHDCENKGRGVHPKGEAHGRCRSSEKEIRNMLVDVYLHGMGIRKTARKFNVVSSRLIGVISGRNWSHVGAEFGIPKRDQAIYRTQVTLQPA